MLRCRLESSFHLLERYSVQPRVVRCATPGARLACGKCKREEDQVRGRQTRCEARQSKDGEAAPPWRGGHDVAALETSQAVDHSSAEAQAQPQAGRGQQGIGRLVQVDSLTRVARRHRIIGALHPCTHVLYSNTPTAIPILCHTSRGDRHTPKCPSRARSACAVRWLADDAACPP